MNLLLIHIPKTAGISIQNQTGVNVKCLGHLYAKEILLLSKYYSIAVSRNPYDRFMSSYYFYRDKYKGIREIGQAIKKYSTFKAFTDNFNNFIYNDDRQFIPQYKYICDNDGKIIIDQVLRFEYLNKDWKEITGLKNLPHMNKSNILNWRKEYDDGMIKVVNDLYKKDFKMFGYNAL